MASQFEITEDIRQALRTFAAANGRTWKSKLRHEWETGGYGLGDLAQPLMQFRNTAGPSGLMKITPSMLAA